MHKWNAVIGLVVLGLLSAGCPKNIPQPEIDAAEQAIANIEDTKDCAPETYRAAQAMMDRARALLKEERFEEARTAMLAARNLSAQARKECDQKKKESENIPPENTTETDNAVNETDFDLEDHSPPNLSTIYFGFDESILNDEARQILTKNAEVMQLHSRFRIQIEGHCDSRGSTEYNLALGERRAMTVKQYIVKLGVNPNRLEIISYGEERPDVSEQHDEAWNLNRRAEFSILQ